jgi:hypothetical protein
LAIHRAIKSATFASGDSNDTAATLTLSDTQLIGGVQVPILFTGQGARTVYFPPGAYYISRPLVVNHGTQLRGEGAPDKSFIYTDSYGEYNAIESFGMYFVREFGLTATESNVNQQAPDFFSFMANLQIHHLNIRLNPNTKPLFTRSGTTATVTLPFNHNWQIGDVIATTGGGTPSPLAYINTTITGVPAPNQIQFTVANSGATTGGVYVRNVTRIEEYPAAWYVFPMNQPFARRSSGGAAGSNTITLNKSLGMAVGNRVRFSGGNDEYTIASISGATLTMTSNFTRSIAASEILMMGLPAQNGICVNGGEDAMIAHCYSGEMQGAGIMIYGSSPACVVLGCMSNSNYAGYWLDGTIGGTFIKPSGDGNYIFYKLGSVKAIASVLIESMKMEDFVDFPSRCVFQVYADSTGADACLTVLNGSVNAGTNTVHNMSRAMIEGYKIGVELVYNFIGFFAGNYGGDVLRMYNKRTGALVLRRGRTFPSESANNLSGDTMLNVEGTLHKTWVDGTAAMKTYIPQDSNFMGNGGGIIGDLGTFLIPSASFTRSSTVFTLTIPSHGLVVGDYVALTNTQNYSPWISFVTNSAGDPAYFNGCAKVQSIVDADTLTITVVNSGPVSGTCEVRVMRYWYFHQIKNGAHVFQMPNATSPTADKSMVKFISRNSRTQLSGLNVPALDTGEWWAKDQFTMGGTVSAPAVRLLTGTGAPSASAPDGSLYLRTDGTADTTLYVRAAGAWAALTTT